MRRRATALLSNLLIAGSLASVVGACSMGRPGMIGDEDGDGFGDGDGGGGNGGGNGGGGGGGTGDDCEQSIELGLAVEALPPDLVVVLDRSSSMGLETVFGSFILRWDVVRQALDDILTSFDTRAHFGLMLAPAVSQYFCEAGQVDVAPSASGAGSITTMLDTTEPGGASPTGASLRNLREYFSTAAVNPNGRHVILASDGKPTCSQTAVADTVAAIGRLRTDGITTYVLGYSATDDTAVLDDFAAAGGTGTHFAATTSAALIDALSTIATEVTTVACSYPVPGGPRSADALNVVVDGDPVPYDPDHTDGWDYTPGDTMLTFYGAACDALRQPQVSDIDVSFCPIVE